MLHYTYTTLMSSQLEVVLTFLACYVPSKIVILTQLKCFPNLRLCSSLLFVSVTGVLKQFLLNCGQSESAQGEGAANAMAG
jgi:hypothetical protein